MDIYKEYPRKFLNADDDMGDPDTIRKAFGKLGEMKVDNKDEAWKWMEAWSEVNSAASEVQDRAYFAMTKDVNNKEVEAEFSRLIEHVVPLCEELDEKAKQRFLSFPEEWVPGDFRIARMNAQWDVELFNEDNLPLNSQDMMLRKEYQKISGSWITDFDGEKKTPAQLRPLLESTDRDVREKAWRAIVAMHLADYDKLNDLFDKILPIRKKIAENAGMPDFVEYKFKDYRRLSYNKDDVKAFRDAIHKYVVPAAGKIIERRKRKLELDTFRPWDTSVDPDNAQPPKIYEDIDDLKDKVARVMGSIDPQFSDAFKLMDKKGYLDLENRPGKAPGAYMMTFEEERISIIFSNFVGTSRDFDTLIHEGGHAMHGFLSRHLLKQAREVPLEFAEVASMSLELLARPYLDIVYNEDDRQRLGVKQLESTIMFLPFMACLDEFQAWVYTDPDGADRDKRAEYWKMLTAKYRPSIDYSGLEKEAEIGWQYLHVYEVPLYYVEYGIAQIGALQVFLRSLDDYDGAVKDYRHALGLGSTVGLSELFEAAGVKFIMKHPDVLEDMTNKIMEQVGL